MPLPLGPSHIAAQLISHGRHDRGISEAEKERNIDNSPDHQWNMPRENRAKDHAATDEQGAPMISPAPHGNRGVH